MRRKDFKTTELGSLRKYDGRDTHSYGDERARNVDGSGARNGEMRGNYASGMVQERLEKGGGDYQILGQICELTLGKSEEES